jgi:hypothetical protein
MWKSDSKISIISVEFNVTDFTNCWFVNFREKHEIFGRMWVMRLFICCSFISFSYVTSYRCHISLRHRFLPTLCMIKLQLWSLKNDKNLYPLNWDMQPTGTCPSVLDGWLWSRKLVSILKHVCLPRLLLLKKISFSNTVVIWCDICIAFHLTEWNWKITSPPSCRAVYSSLYQTSLPISVLIFE